MDPANSSVGQIRRLAENHARELLATAGLVLVIGALFSRFKASRQPQSLGDPIPYIFNTLQFLTNNEKFMKRVMNAFESCNLAKFYLGARPVYLVSGPQNIQTIFGRSSKVGTEDIFVHNVFPVLYKMPKEYVQRFANDKSGRGRVPARGFEDTPQDQRYWAQYAHVHSEYLAKTEHLKPIIDAFQKQFSKALEKYPAGEWSTVGVIDFCRRDVTECAISTLFGPAMFELNPGFLDAFWAFDDYLFTITLGFPEWLNPRPYRVHNRYLSMIRRYVDAAWANFDWEGPDAEAHWEQHFGARICREIAKWLKGNGFPDISIAGALGSLLFAQNSNSIPTTMWMIVEIIKDPSLLQAIREEVATTITTCPNTGARSFDIQKLVSLPLLQSVFTETLRLRMNFNIIRHAKEPVTMDGFTLSKGAMLQAPMMAAHYDPAIWTTAGHPASEFWAERHVKYTEEKDEDGKTTHKRTFATAGRPSSYFPFGGGAPICPGRHFAKYEILTTVALLVSKFDIEFVEWTKLDGTRSERPAQNDQRYCGAGGMPPDREMKIRLKRNW